MSRHRAEVRPRYGRIAVLGSSLAVTLIAVLGGTGVLPSTADDVPRGAAGQVSGAGSSASATPDEETTPTSSSSPSAEVEELDEPDVRPVEVTPGGTTLEEPDGGGEPTAAGAEDTSLPPDSGAGKRVVFSESRQRVWLVQDGSEVVRTYAVSGSIYDNLEPGTFEVYSRSEDAVGIDDSGTMKYFVRFTQGDTGAAIGFHDIPVLDGERIQTFDQLGTPLSHGCIRQKRSDAIALWDFAPLGTTVVVTA